jgi:hypothetical protein
MDNQNVFSFLKLKASLVLPENKVFRMVMVGVLPGLDTYSINNLNDQASLGNFIKGNPDLTWEKQISSKLELSLV